jgi:hypothetical protein
MCDILSRAHLLGSVCELLELDRSPKTPRRCRSPLDWTQSVSKVRNMEAPGIRRRRDEDVFGNPRLFTALLGTVTAAF